jgi:hypothetical protein
MSMLLLPRMGKVTWKRRLNFTVDYEEEELDNILYGFR